MAFSNIYWCSIRLHNLGNLQTYREIQISMPKMQNGLSSLGGYWMREYREVDLLLEERAELEISLDRTWTTDQALGILRSKIPPRQLDHHVIQGRFEAGHRAFCDGILQVNQRMSESQFGGNKSKRVTCGLGGQSAAP